MFAYPLLPVALSIQAILQSMQTNISLIIADNRLPVIVLRALDLLEVLPGMIPITLPALSTPTKGKLKLLHNKSYQTIAVISVVFWMAEVCVLGIVGEVVFSYSVTFIA